MITDVLKSAPISYVKWDMNRNMTEIGSTAWPAKKQKEIANFRKSLQVNQKVITAGGIHGVIKEINDDHIVLEIASNVKIKIDKNSIFADASAASQQPAK